VAFSPAAVEAQPGGQVTVTLRMENAVDLFSAPVQIKFDPNVLQLEEVARGDFLSGDGREVIFTRNILNPAGEAKMMLRRLPGTGGITGSGTLVTLTFRVVGQGVTTVTAPQLVFQDSRGQTLLTASPELRVTIK
jgi:general secretion pathway protein D